MSAARLAAIGLGGTPAPWTQLGFGVDGDAIPLANGALRFGSHLGLVLADLADLADDLEGIPLSQGEIVPGIEHPNGAFELDHLVITTDSLERTSATVAESLGLPLKRVRETETVRQGFHRFPDQGGARGCIVEVVESPRASGTALMGLVVNVRELDALTAELGDDLVGRPKDAVQPGRRIATVRRSAGLGLPVALMTPA